MVANVGFILLSVALVRSQTFAPTSYFSTVTCDENIVGDGASGETTASFDGLKVKGIGTGLENTADSFYFISSSDESWDPAIGNIVSVGMMSVLGITQGARACLSIRASLLPNSSHVSVCNEVLDSFIGNLVLIYRTAEGEVTGVNGSVPHLLSSPVFLHLRYDAGTFTALFNTTNATSLATIGSISMSMPNGSLLGYGVDNNGGFDTTGNFDGKLCGVFPTLSPSTNPTSTVAPTRTPTFDFSGLECDLALIGPTATGTAGASSGRLEVTSTGPGLGNTSDEVVFAYRKTSWFSGSGEVVDVILNKFEADVGSEACVTVRENLKPGARYAGICFIKGDPVGSLFVTQRSVENGTADVFGFAVSNVPVAMRLSDTGGGVRGSLINNEEEVDIWEVSLGFSEGLIGYALTSSQSQPASAQFDGSLCQLPTQIPTVSPSTSTGSPSVAPSMANLATNSPSTGFPTSAPSNCGGITIVRYSFKGEGRWVVQRPFDQADYNIPIQPVSIPAAQNWTFTAESLDPSEIVTGVYLVPGQCPS